MRRRIQRPEDANQQTMDAVLGKMNAHPRNAQLSIPRSRKVVKMGVNRVVKKYSTSWRMYISMNQVAVAYFLDLMGANPGDPLWVTHNDDEWKVALDFGHRDPKWSYKLSPIGDIGSGKYVYKVNLPCGNYVHPAAQLEWKARPVKFTTLKPSALLISYPEIEEIK